jgi:hypothetical protein
MQRWFVEHFVMTGRLPLFSFFAGMVLGFAFIRFSVRMIRANVRWWPGNITPGGMHIHHVVFGVVLMLVGGVAGLAVPDDAIAGRVVTASVFGVGAALVLDEFALILHLRDVYWSEEGRLSVDAVFVAVAFTGLLLVGVHPMLLEILDVSRDASGEVLLGGALTAVLNLLLAVITLIKGKIWSGLLGLFVPILLIIGAVRLARPHSPWARWRYRTNTGRGRRKLATARWREQRLRQPVVRAKIWFQDMIAGQHESS